MAKRYSGLTLIELMVTLAVAIVLFAIGIPLFDNIQRNNRGVSQVNALVASINLARSEAVKTGNPVSVCPKADWSQTLEASIACGDQGDWAQGWIVFNDPDGDGAYTYDASAPDLIRIWTPPPWEAKRFADGDAPLTNITQKPSSTDFVIFNGRGELENDPAPMCLRVFMEGAPTERYRYLSINAVGRLELTDNAAVWAACP